MIDPNAIPQIPGDMGALSGHATAVSGVGAAVPGIGSRVHSTWQGLAAVYEAPEAGQLLAATGPVQTVSASIGQDVSAVGAALSTYATEVAAIKARLEALRAQARTFVDTTGAAEDWREDEGDVERHNQLLSDVNGAVAEFMDAQRRCANAILAQYSDQRYTAENGDGTITAFEFGYTREQLDGALAQDAALPWGTSEEHDRGFFGDVGAFVGGMWTGGVDMVKGLGALIGYADGEWSWSTAGGAWKGLGVFALALSPLYTTLNAHMDLPGLKKGTLHNTLIGAGKALIAYDTWGEDKAKAAGMTTFNVVSAVLGTKGAGAGLRGGGAAVQGSRIAAVAKTGTVLVRAGEFVGKLPTVEGVIKGAVTRIQGLRLPPIDLPDIDIPPTHVDPPRTASPVPTDRDGVLTFGRPPADVTPVPSPGETRVGMRDGVIGNWPVETPSPRPDPTPAAPDTPSRADTPDRPLVQDGVIGGRPPTIDPGPATGGTQLGLRDGVIGNWPIDDPRATPFPDGSPDTSRQPAGFAAATPSADIPRTTDPANAFQPAAAGHAPTGPLVQDGVIGGRPPVVDPTPTPATAGTQLGMRDGVLGNWPVGAPHTTPLFADATPASGAGTAPPTGGSRFGVQDGVVGNSPDTPSAHRPDGPTRSDGTVIGLRDGVLGRWPVDAPATPDVPGGRPTDGPDDPRTPPPGNGPDGDGPNGADGPDGPDGGSPDGPEGPDGNATPDRSGDTSAPADHPTPPDDHTASPLDLLAADPAGPGKRSLGVLPESHVDRGPDGLIESVDGRPVAEYLHEVGQHRAAQFREGRVSGDFSRNDIGNVTSVAIDLRTGHVYEGTNGRPSDVIQYDELHPLLRQRLEALGSGPGYPDLNGDGSVGPAGTRPYPAPDKPLGHAEVKAVDELLWRRGPHADASVFGELRVDNFAPFQGGGVVTKPCCANCSALLWGTPSNAGRYSGYPGGPHNLLPE